MGTSQKQIGNEAYGKIPLFFIPNQGHIDHPEIQFYAHKGGFQCGFTSENIVLAWISEKSQTKSSPPSTFSSIEEELEKEKTGTTLSLRFLNPNPEVKLKAQGQEKGKVNYFRGE